MKIEIGTRFEKRVGKSMNVCYISDIIECEYKSLAMGNISHETIYYAKSETYAMGSSFQVPKATIIRGLIK